ncbi:MAG: hypothetical protein WCK77_22400 [Verrucomicrobiota bacterium]
MARYLEYCQAARKRSALPTPRVRERRPPKVVQGQIKRGDVVHEACACDWQFVCSYCVGSIPLTDEDVFENLEFRRHDSIDTLRVRKTPTGRALGEESAAASGDQQAAILSLLRALKQAGVEYARREDFRGGLLNVDAVLAIGAERVDAKNRILASARANPGHLVAVAQELGLAPESVGPNDKQWRSRCPGTNHYLYIHSGTETFGCGYCKLQGGEKQLREIVVTQRAEK